MYRPPQQRLIVCRDLFGWSLVPENLFQDRLGVYGIIFKDDKIALVRNRSNGRWSFPGGGTRGNESHLQTARREIDEEIGLPVVRLIKRVYHRWLRFCYNPKHTPVFRAYHQDTNVYLVEVEHFDLKPDDQVDDGECEKPRWLLVRGLRKKSFANEWMWDAFREARKARKKTKRSAG